jgi:hypothetical protein
MKQGKYKPVQEFFVRIGDTSYNYKIKKPNADIRGPVIVIPEDCREAFAQYMALQLAVRQEVHELEYEQFNTNNVTYLGLQFFIAGLHPDIQLEVIKSGRSDLYEAFKTAHPCETALQNKKIYSASSAKVNELELDAVNNPEEREAVAQKLMFSTNSGFGGSGNGATYHGDGNGNCSAQPQTGQRKPNPAFGKTCHYCKKKNHFQCDCL